MKLKAQCWSFVLSLIVSCPVWAQDTVTLSVDVSFRNLHPDANGVVVVACALYSDRYVFEEGNPIAAGGVSLIQTDASYGGDTEAQLPSYYIGPLFSETRTVSYSGDQFSGAVDVVLGSTDPEMWILWQRGRCELRIGGEHRPERCTTVRRLTDFECVGELGDPALGVIEFRRQDLPTELEAERGEK